MTIDQEWFFYIVRCKDGSLYSGVTNNLGDRLKKHNNGKGARYTSGRRPVRLVHSERYRNMSEALKREAQIKSRTRENKERLIAMAQKQPTVKTCGWTADNPLMIEYHDTEWGVPVHDDRRLFECLVLGGAQAGLSWQTILNKRTAYRRAFDNFDFRTVARYGERDIQRLLADVGIVRNRLKIAAAINNAAKLLEVQKEFGSFDAYLWRFVGGKPLDNRIKSLKDIPAVSEESDALSKDLRSRGFKFVGSTICYAFMQAVGMVNDHLVTCFRHDLKS